MSQKERESILRVRIVQKTLDTPGIKGSDFLQPTLREQHQDIQNSRQNEIADMESSLHGRRQAEIDAENLRHQNKMDEIQNTIDRLEHGEITPSMGVDSDTYLRELNRSLGTETALNADNLSQIRDAYRKELQDSTKQIMENYSQKERELLRNAIKDYVKEHGYDTKGELDNLRDFLSTNGFGGETAGIEVGGGVLGSGETAGIEIDGGALGSGETAGIEVDGGVLGSGEAANSELGGDMSESGEGDEVMEIFEGISDLTEEELERLLEGMKQFLESEYKGSGGGNIAP